MMNRFHPENHPICIITRDVTVEELRLIGGSAAEARYPGLLQTLAKTQNAMQGMIAEDMAEIIAKQQRGEINDEQYESMRTIYPDLPAV